MKESKVTVARNQTTDFKAPKLIKINNNTELPKSWCVNEHKSFGNRQLCCTHSYLISKYQNRAILEPSDCSPFFFLVKLGKMKRKRRRGNFKQQSRWIQVQ